MSLVRICVLFLIMHILFTPVSTTNAQTSVQKTCPNVYKRISLSSGVSISPVQTSSRVVLEKIDNTGGLEGKWRVITFQNKDSASFNTNFPTSFTKETIHSTKVKGCDGVLKFSKKENSTPSGIACQTDFIGGDWVYDIWHNYKKKVLNSISSEIRPYGRKRWMILRGLALTTRPEPQ